MLTQNLGILLIPNNKRYIFLSGLIASARPISLIRALRIPKLTTALNGMWTLELRASIVIIISLVHVIAAIHASLMRGLTFSNTHASSNGR